MLGSRPTIIIMKSFPYQVIIKVTDEAFVSGISMKALSLQTGDSVSAVCECQEAASCPYRPSKGRKSRIELDESYELCIVWTESRSQLVKTQKEMQCPNR
jgi:hypothetical protein